MTLEQLLNDAVVEAAAIGVIVSLVIQSLKPALLPNDRVEDLLPLIAIGLGILFGILYAFIRSEDILLYAVSGLVGGGFASGLYDSIHSQTKKGK